MIKNRKNIFFLSALIALDISLIALLSKRLDPQHYWVCLLLSILVTYVTWEANLLVHVILGKKFPVKTKLIERIKWQGIINIILTSVIIKTYFFLFYVFIAKKEFTGELYIFEVFIAIIISLFINSVYIGYEVFKEWKEAVIEKESLRKESIESQYQALKNQVNPHFLFNSLNTLASIIPEDPNLSVEFVQKLSSVYRYVLQNKDKELVDLKTEIDFIKSYLFLQQIRFGENIKTEINIPEEMMHANVAPLTIQMLIENAIKHNIISSAHPLNIEIYSKDSNSIVVKNNLQKKSAVEDSTGIGLNNIVNRYKFLTSKPVELVITATEFIITLPLLKTESYEGAHY